MFHAAMQIAIDVWKESIVVYVNESELVALSIYNYGLSYYDFLYYIIWGMDCTS